MTAPPSTRRDSIERTAGPKSQLTVVRSGPVASIWVRGAFVAAWAVMVGLASLVVLALIVWAADSRSTASAAGVSSFAGQLWLLALRDPLRVSGGTLTIPPLGLTLMLGLLLARASAIVARSAHLRDARDLGLVVAAVTIPFAALATVLAAVDHSAAIRPSVGAAFVCAAVVGAISSAAGAAWGAKLVTPTWRELPADARAALDAAGAGGVVILAAGVVLLVGSLLLHAPQVGKIAASYRGGPGEFAMLLLSVLYLPNALAFAVGYVIGPGFAVGAGTSVTLGGAHLGAAPAFPLLAAVPSGPAPLAVRLFCAVAVLGAGAAAGWRVCRRPQPVRQQLRVVVLAAVVAGISAAAIAGYAGGPSGPGRLRAVGSSPWQLGLAATAELGVLASLVVLGVHWQRRRQVGAEGADAVDVPAVIDVR